MDAILTTLEGGGRIVLRLAGVEPHASGAARRAYRGAYQVVAGSAPVDVSGLPTAAAAGGRECDGVTVAVGSWGMRDLATVRLLAEGERDAILAELAARDERRRAEAEREAEYAAMPVARVNTGAEADIEATYPGGYRAFVRDGRRADRIAGDD